MRRPISLTLASETANYPSWQIAAIFFWFFMDSNKTIKISKAQKFLPGKWLFHPKKLNSITQSECFLPKSRN